MENLRKIKFTLEGHGILGYERLGLSDYPTEQQYKDATEQRKGFFHTFGFEFQKIGDNYTPISCAIVESEDGKVYKVNPENVTFIDK